MRVSPVSWVISQNLRRRHLDAGQRAAVAVDAKPLLAAEAKKNQEKAGAANLAKFNGKASSLKNEKTSKPVHVEKSVASQFDVSQGYVYAAQKIKEKDEKVFQEVKSGAPPLSFGRNGSIDSFG